MSKWVDPNYTSQSQTGTSYPLGIDAALAIAKRFGGWFNPRENDEGSPSPDLTIIVDPGFIWNGVGVTEKAQQAVSGFTIPTSGQHRIDRVVVDALTGVATRVAGTAVAGSPSAVAPAIPAGKIPIAQILITSADVAITNSMITDERVFHTTGRGDAKVFGSCDVNAATLATPKGITSFTDTSSALKAVAFSVTFASADYTCLINVTQSSNSAVNDNYKAIAQTTTGCSIYNAAETNVTHISIACFGDLA